MAARRCVLHGSYPASLFFIKCPVCGENTSYIDNAEPDEFWEQNIERYKAREQEAEALVPDIPVLTGARVKIDREQYYISTHDVINGGVRHQLRETDLIQVGKQVFEILSYSYEDRRYLVQPFSTELTVDELTALAKP